MLSRMLSVLFVLFLDTPKVASASSLRSNEGTQIKDQDTSGTPRRPNAPSLASGVDGLKESVFPLRPRGVGEKKKRQDLLLFQYEPHVFSHFSYHSSGRSLLVCDLQGMYDPLCLGVKQGRVTGRHEHTKAAAFQLLMAHSFKLPNQ